jgi:hypothetical protein
MTDRLIHPILKCSAVTLLAMAAPSRTAAQHAHSGAYEEIGRAATRVACDFDRSWWRFDTCEGFAQFNLFDPGRRFDAGEWIQRLEWDPTRHVQVREGGLRIVLSMIKNPRDIALRELDRRGTVIARIQADPEGPADERYKIGGAYTSGRRFTGDFYVIIDRYAEVRDAGDSASRKIANWRLFGLRSTGELVAMPANGAFRFCAMAPEHKPLVAPLIASCESRHEFGKLAEEYGKDNVLQIITAYSEVRAAGKDPSEALTGLGTSALAPFSTNAREATMFGVSLPCGVGCCVTEFGFDLPEEAAAFGAVHEWSRWPLLVGHRAPPRER